MSKSSKKMSKVLFLVVFILSQTGELYPQFKSVKEKSVLSGIVSNEKDESLSGVVISVKSSSYSYSVNSDNKGKFRIEINPGVYNVNVIHEGYNNYSFRNLKIDSGESRELNILLIEKIVSTEEIDVEGVFRQSQDDLRTSVYNLRPTDVKVLPGAVEDVLRSLRSLPGVSSPNDFSSQIVVRGSGPDENLIIMDDVEIFNPYRLYGLVSMFNPETLNDITLITGGFPAKYGDRLSAVLDVTNKEGDRNSNLKGIINTSITNANLIFSGKNPFSIPGSWLVSSRRTYYDLIIGPFAKKAGLITDDSSLPNFRDLQFKLAFGPAGNNRFYANGIFSQDGVDIIPGEDNDQPDSIVVTDVTKNNMASFSWHFNPGKKFISRTTFSWYQNKGDNDFDSELLDPLIDQEGYTPEQRDSLRQIGALLGLSFNSTYTFSKLSLGNKSILLSPKTDYEFGGGIDFVKTDLSYKLKVDDQFRSIFNSLPGSSAFQDDFSLTGEYNARAYLYGQANYKINKQYFIQPSLRLDYFDIIKTPYVSPRINLGYAIDPLTTLRTSLGVYYQSPGLEKLVDGRTFYDLRDADEKGIKAEKAYHLIAGIDRWISNEWQAKFEGYYKRFSDLLEQEKLTGYRYEFSLNDPSNTDPSYIKNYSNWVRSSSKLPYDSLTTNPVNIGTGEAYGFEISLEKKYSSEGSRFSGWVNYSLSFSNREKYGITNPYRFDQRHVANVVLNYRTNSWLELGMRWTYASNFPITTPVGITPRLVADSIAVNPLSREVLFNLDFGSQENQFSDSRPAYHRLDFRATAYTYFWSTEWAFYIDVINVYNRKNVLGYDYSITNDLHIKRKTVGMFPILPTIGVNARF